MSERLLSVAKTSNARLVLLNRRGYPGALPFSAEEIPTAGTDLEEFMKQRTSELLEFLATFISTEKVSTVGGLTICGWSLGSAFALALLAYATSFSNKAVASVVVPHIRQIVLFGLYFIDLSRL
jgi:hypothetical protein